MFLPRVRRYIFRGAEKVGLQELGPRLTLKLRSLQKGTFDSKHGEYIWVHKVSLTVLESCVSKAFPVYLFSCRDVFFFFPTFRESKWTPVEESFTCEKHVSFVLSTKNQYY